MSLTLLCLLGALQSFSPGCRRGHLRALTSAAVIVVVLLSHRTDAGAASFLELVEYSMWLFAGPLA